MNEQEDALRKLLDAVQRHHTIVYAGEVGLTSWHTACQETARRVEEAYKLWRATW